MGKTGYSEYLRRKGSLVFENICTNRNPEIIALSVGGRTVLTRAYGKRSLKHNALSVMRSRLADADLEVSQNSPLGPPSIARENSSSFVTF